MSRIRRNEDGSIGEMSLELHECPAASGVQQKRVWDLRVRTVKAAAIAVVYKTSVKIGKPKESLNLLNLLNLLE